MFARPLELFYAGGAARFATGDAGNLIINYLEGKGISWMAWCFDPEWGPTVLASWDYELTGPASFSNRPCTEKPGTEFDGEKTAYFIGPRAGGTEVLHEKREV